MTHILIIEYHFMGLCRLLGNLKFYRCYIINKQFLTITNNYKQIFLKIFRVCIIWVIVNCTEQVIKIV